MIPKRTLLMSLLIFNLFSINSVIAKVYVVCSAALIQDGFELRKGEYIKCLEILKQYGYPQPYIIEAIQKSPTFFEEYTPYVFYSTVNDASLKNKGVNEARTMLQGLKHFNFKPDDMIIKLTGRYHLKSDYFLRLVEQNPDIDGFFKGDGPNSARTFCFALRYRYLKEFLEQRDYPWMEKNMICIEHEARRYLQKIAQENNAKIMEVQTLDMMGLVWGDPGYKPGVLHW